LYMLQSLCSRACYMEIIMIDTPLLDEEVRNRISQVYTEGTKAPLEDKLKSILFFVEHLHEIELNEQARVASAGLGGVCPIRMTHIISAVTQEVENIRERVKKKKLGTANY